VTVQDKSKEIEFFDRHAAADDYNVFTQAANTRLIDSFVRLTGLRPGAHVADLGCGSGVFTNILAERGYDAQGIDISPKLIDLARSKYPKLTFLEGDVEKLPYADNSLDGVLLSGLVHHFPDPSRCAAETFRVLRRGGRFMAFDPNRANPFMYLYRDKSSPLYSSRGVTENERPVVAGQVVRVFSNAGFVVSTDYLGSLAYRYIASPAMRTLLPVYNFLDDMLFRPQAMRHLRPFVLTYGDKP
jgi:ubiquinone/menaquinone biosynthesis C-methylase UbiE